MSETLPTLRQLTYLEALGQTLHFGRAANACLVSQSTLSNGVQELERLLGAQLVVRNRRQVMLTPVGEDVLRRSAEILNNARDMVHMVEASSRPLAGTLRLGVIPTIAPFWFPHRLPALTKAYPDLHLKVKEGLSTQLLDDLQRGKIDVALMALPYPADGMQVRILAQDPFILAVPSGHHLSQKSGASLSDLLSLEAEMLLLDEGHCLRDHALESCKLTPSRTEFSATSLFTIIELVREGLGVTLLPKMAVDSGLGGIDGVSLIPLMAPMPARQIGLFWPKTSPRDGELTLLATSLADL